MPRNADEGLLDQVLQVMASVLPNAVMPLLLFEERWTFPEHDLTGDHKLRLEQRLLLCLLLVARPAISTKLFRNLRKEIISFAAQVLKTNNNSADPGAFVSDMHQTTAGLILASLLDQNEKCSSEVYQNAGAAEWLSLLSECPICGHPHVSSLLC